MGRVRQDSPDGDGINLRFFPGGSSNSVILNGAGSLTAATIQHGFSSAKFDGASSLMVLIPGQRFDSAEFDGTGSLSAFANLNNTGLATFAGAGSIAADAKPPFNPVNLVGTQGGFWRADMGVTLSGSDVTLWADQSPNGNDLPQSFVAPTWTSTAFNSSFPGIVFAGTSGTGEAFNVFPANAKYPSTSTQSAFFLMTDNSTNVNTTYIGIACPGPPDTNPSWELNYESGPSVEFISSGSTDGGPYSFTQNIPQAIGSIYNGTTGAAYINFSSPGSASNPGLSFGGPSSQTHMGGGTKFVLAYALITNNVMSAGDISDLKAWTNANWGTSF